MTTEGGVMKMRPLDGSMCRPTAVTLKPGGAHIMLMAQQPLQAGQSFH